MIDGNEPQKAPKVGDWDISISIRPNGNGQ
jgi:hypothetical protein